MNIEPLRNMVLIQADEEAKQTKSGIFVAHEWKKLPHTGDIVAVGPDTKIVKKGNKVHFNRYAFTPLGENLFLGAENNINAKIEIN
jgi:chaperonin GroES